MQTRWFEKPNLYFKQRRNYLNTPVHIVNVHFSCFKVIRCNYKDPVPIPNYVYIRFILCEILAHVSKCSNQAECV